MARQLALSGCMSTIHQLFPTLIYRAELKNPGILNYRLETAALDLAARRCRRPALVRQARLPRLHLLWLAKRPGRTPAHIRQPHEKTR